MNITPTTKLDWALDHARRGFHVFPCLPNSKEPDIKGWPDRATRDERTLRKWWGNAPDRNIGLALGKEIAPGRYTAAIDVDMKRDGAGNLVNNGEASLDALCADLGIDYSDLRTLSQQTPSGMWETGEVRGGHLLYWTTKPVASSVGLLGPGIDVRGAGGYVVGAGSTLDGKTYARIDVPIRRMPAALEERIGAARERTSAPGATLEGIDLSRAVKRGREFLVSAPVAVERQGGDTTTFKVACTLKDMGCDKDQALDLMATHWNPRCVPPWSPEELADKVANAYQYGREPVGASAPEAVFDAQPDPDATKADAPLLKMTCVADVESKPIRWLWRNTFAYGKHSTIAGDPGLGKSQISIALASVVSTGGELPNGERCEKGDVIFITAEDDIADTIRPRLEAAGADLARIHIVEGVPVRKENGTHERAFDLTSDVARLRAVAETLPTLRLVVIDPLTAFLGKTDSHKAAEVRAAMGEISKLAEHRGAALLSINHLNKASGANAMARVNGSGALVAAPRAAYIVTRHEDDDTKRVMAPLKNNIGDDQTAYLFKVESIQLPGGISTSRVAWLGEETISADEALGHRLERGGGAVGQAQSFLLTSLGQGPRRSTEIQEEAKAEGIKPRTLRRAREALQIIVEKESGNRGGHFVWRLPDKLAEQLKLPDRPEDIFK